MCSFGSDAADADAEPNPNPNLDLQHTQKLDSPLSPSPSSVEESRGEYETQYFEDTEFLYDTVPLDDAFETQVVDFGCETQVVDFGGETQVLDYPDEIEDMETQLLDEFDDEIALDSDGEGTDKTEVLSDNDELPGNDLGWSNGQSDYQEKMEAVIEQADVLIDEQHNSAHQNMDLKNQFNSERHGVENNGLSSSRSSLEVGKEVIQGHDKRKWIENEKEFRIEDNSKVRSSAVRELSDNEDHKGFSSSNNNSDEGEKLFQPPSGNGDVAGLSYADSQEPGDLSQAYALDFVDKFLKTNTLELDQDIVHEKSTRGKLNSLSTAKGPQNLAKRASGNFIVREKEVFDWDDCREDEGGGDIFCRKKEFFGSKTHGRSFPRTQKKPKSCRVNQQREKGSNLHKMTGLVHSDSRLMMKKGAQIAEMIPKRNLMNEFDEQVNVHVSKGQLETIVTETSEPDIPDIGFDTQTAAEAMEALCRGDEFAKYDANDAYPGVQNNSEISPDGDCRGNIENSRKRGHPSSIGVVTRQSKKRIGAELSEEALISTGKRSKNVRLTYDTVQVITRSKRAQSNRSGNLEKVPSKNNEQRKAIVSERSITGDDAGIDGTIMQRVDGLIKKQCLEGEGIRTPVAKRTRHSLAINQLQRDQSMASDCQEDRDMSSIESRKVGRRNSTGIKASRLLKTKQKYSLSESNQSGELENVNTTQLEQSNAKLSDMANVSLDAWSYPKGRRSRRNLPVQVNRYNICFGSKRKTRSSSRASPNVSSSNKNLEERLTGQCLDKCGLWEAGWDYNSASKNVETKSTDLVGTEAVKHTEKNDFDSQSTPQHNAVATTRLSESPRKISRQPESATVTPSPTSCKTPVHDGSPVCMGNEYYRQSCKRNLSRSYLTREISSLTSTSSAWTPPFKDLRKRRDTADVRVLYSQHLDDNIVKRQKKILARLGVSIASSVSDATHFIADKFVRTRNMLEAIASGKPVVTHLWLDSCGQANCFIDEKNHILRDTKKERELGFSMPVSLARASQCPLLQGRRVFITPNTKPGKETISSLIKAVQGQAVERIGRSSLKDDIVPDNLLVISCEEDEELCVPFLEKGAAVYSSELLLNGIVTQRLNYERHRLFADHVKKTRSTIWMKTKDGDKFHPVPSAKAKQKHSLCKSVGTPSRVRCRTLIAGHDEEQCNEN